MGRRVPGPSAKMKRLTLDIPEELHRVIKIAAAQEGVTMAEKLRSLLAKHYGVEPDKTERARTNADAPL